MTGTLSVEPHDAVRRGLMQFDGYDSRLPIARCPAGDPVKSFFDPGVTP